MSRFERMSQREVRAEIRNLHELNEAILARARAEDRERLSDAETALFDGREEEIREAETYLSREPGIRPEVPGSEGPESRGGGVGEVVGIDERTGREVRALAAADSWAAHIRSAYGTAPEGLDLGRALRAQMRGQPLELRSMDRTTHGEAVNAWLSEQVIDRLRKRSALTRAGARVIPLNQSADSFHFVVVDSDPEPAWREELGAIAESAPNFRRVTFIPQSLSVLVRFSRELLQDSTPNLEATLVQTLGAAFGEELDRVGLVGSGVAPEPRGVENVDGIHDEELTTPIVSYADVLTARRLILEAHTEPTGAIMSPGTEAAYAGLTDSTGQPLRRPQVIENMPFLTTTDAPAETVFVADWSHVWIGVREFFGFEVLRERFADTGEIGVVGHLRADIGIVHPDAFVKLAVPVG